MAELLEQILSDYRSWLSVPSELEIKFADALRSPARNAWLSGCYRAVQSADRDWLTTVCDADKYPLLYLDDRGVEEEQRRLAALFISHCALAALVNKGEDEAPDATKAAQSTANVLYPSDTSALACNRLISYFSSVEPGIQTTSSYADFVAVDKFQHKQICRFHVEKHPDGDGRVFRDPVAMSFSIFRDGFIESINKSADYLRANSAEFNQYDYTWRVSTGPDQTPFDSPLENKSVGLAAAIALNDAARGETLGNTVYVFSGQLAGNGSLLRIGDSKSKIEKTQENGRRIIIPAQNREDDIRLANWIDSLPTDSAVFAKSFIDATESLRKWKASLVRKQQVQKLKSVGAVASIILFVLFIWAVVASTRLRAANQILDQKKDELEYANGELQKKKVELEDANGELRKKKVELEDANYKLEKFNKNLGQKNSQLIVANDRLDVARRNEENQRKLAQENEREAKVQTAKAEKNEEVAKAYQQIATANQLAYQGVSSLKDKDFLSAQSYFAESLTFNDSLFGRSGLLNATFSNPLSQRFDWSLEQPVSNQGGSPLDLQDMALYAFSLDRTGEYFAYPLPRRHEISFRSVQKNEEIEKINLNDKESLVIAISPGGTRLAISTSDGDLLLRDRSSKKLTTIYSTREEGVGLTALAFDYTGRYLAVGVLKKGIVIMDLTDNSVIRSFPQLKDDDEEIDLEEAVIASLIFNASGALAFATLTENLDSHLGFIPDFKQNEVFIHSADGFIISLSFVNEKQLISSGIGWKTWSVEKQDITENASGELGANPQTLAAASSHLGFYVSTGGDGIKIWNVESRTLVAQFAQMTGKPFQIALGDNGTVLVRAVDNARHVRIFCWNINKLNNLAPIPKDDVDASDRDRVSYNGRYVSFDDSKRLLAVNESLTKKTVFSKQFDTSPSICLLVVVPRLSRNGDRLLVKTMENQRVPNSNNRYTHREKLTLYNLISSEESVVYSSTFQDTDQGEGRSCSDRSDASMASDSREFLSDDGTLVAFKTKDNSVSVVSTQNPNSVLSVISSYLFPDAPIPDLPSQPPFSIDSSDSKLIRIVPANRDIKDKIARAGEWEASRYYNFELYDIQNGQLTAVIPSVEALTGFDLSRDGKRFATTDLNGRVCIWELDPYRKLAEVLRTGDYVSVLSPTFSPDGRLLAWISGGTGNIHFFDLENHERLPDWPTGDLVVKINFVGNDKLSIFSSAGVTTTDISDVKQLSTGNARVVKDILRSKSNFGLHSAFPPIYEQSNLDKVLPENKSKIPPTFFVGYDASGRTTEFNDRAGFANVSKSNGGRTDENCEPLFLLPVFNPYPLGHGDDRPACSDLPLLSIRNTIEGEGYPTNRQELEHRSISTAGTLEGRVYLRNGAIDNSDHPDLKNVAVQLTFVRKDDSGKYDITGCLIADNALGLCANLALGTSVNQTLILGEQIEIRDWQSRLVKTIKLSDYFDDVLSSYFEDGQTEGKREFKVPIGDLKPGFRNQLFLKFRFVMDKAGSTPPGINKETGIISEEEMDRSYRNFLIESTKPCKRLNSVPVFNPYTLTYFGVDEECRDYPLIQGKSKSGEYPTNAEELKRGVTGSDRDLIKVLVYFHNGAGQQVEVKSLAITNFRLTVTFDPRPGPVHKITATLSGDNVKPVTGSMEIFTTSDERLEIVHKSGSLYDLRMNNLGEGFEIGKNGLIQEYLLPGFAHSGFIGFTVKVVSNNNLAIRTCNSATINGHVSPTDTEALGWFEWGETIDLENTTAPQRFTKDSDMHEIIVGLAGNTTYYYRTMVSNPYGKWSANILSFTTPACQKVPPGSREKN